MHVWGRLAIYKKKILTRSTLKESVYTLEEDACKIRYRVAGKKSGKKESRKEKWKKDASVKEAHSVQLPHGAGEDSFFDPSELANEFDLGAKLKDVLLSFDKVSGKKQAKSIKDERASMDLTKSMKLQSQNSLANHLGSADQGADRDRSVKQTKEHSSVLDLRLNAEGNESKMDQWQKW